MKERVLFVCILMFLVLSSNAQFFEDSIPDFSIDTAKKLAKKGRLVLVEEFKDFRYSKCAKEVAKELGFKIAGNPQRGLCTWDSILSSEIWAFNVFMKQRLVEKLGSDWRVKFDSSVLACVGNFCCTNADLDSFYFRGQFSSGFLFDNESSSLNIAQKCIISNMLVDIMHRYPMLVFKLDGASSFDEKDVTGNLALNRALAVKQFVVSKGINPKRLMISSSGTKSNVFEKQLRDKCSFQRKNRSVIISVISSNFSVKNKK
jgi:outer membrane protein OmpA-like peptidoglycan-associated protein